MWTGDNLWHRTVICHNSNCMELELAPKGKDMSSLLVFSTLEAINLSLNIQKDHFFFQKPIPWGLYCLRKVIYTSAVRLRASKLHCPLWLRSEVGKRGSQQTTVRSLAGQKQCGKTKLPMGNINRRIACRVLFCIIHITLYGQYIANSP